MRNFPLPSLVPGWYSSGLLQTGWASDINVAKVYCCIGTASGLEGQVCCLKQSLLIPWNTCSPAKNGELHPLPPEFHSPLRQLLPAAVAAWFARKLESHRRGLILPILIPFALCHWGIWNTIVGINRRSWKNNHCHVRFTGFLSSKWWVESSAFIPLCCCFEIPSGHLT